MNFKAFKLLAQPTFFRFKITPFWILYEVVVCGLMVVCAALLMYFTVELQPSKTPREKM